MGIMEVAMPRWLEENLFQLRSLESSSLNSWATKENNKRKKKVREAVVTCNHKREEGSKEVQNLENGLGEAEIWTHKRLPVAV